MTIVCSYFSPTTPTAATWTEDVSSAIRLGSITGLSAEARLGATGVGNVVLDDPGSTIGHAGDGIVGLKQMFFDETDCPVGNRRLWTGYIGPRTYRRGEGDSLILGADRKIDVTLVEVDDFLNFRVFPPTADDPTSDFVRPAETDVARIAALLTGVDFMSTTLFDDGYVNTVGPVSLDAHDFTGERPYDVLQTCAQASHKNFFVFYNEALNHYTLWYDKFNSDGSDTIAYDSTLSLTNVESERDDVTVFAIQHDAEGTLDPSRVITAARGTGNGVKSYRTLPSTANTFAWRDGSPLSETVTTQAKLDALMDGYLQENSTEDNTIRCTVRLPSSKATFIKKGHRIQCHFTHLPAVSSTMTWCRVLALTIRMDKPTEQFYWLDLTLSPIPPPVDVFLQLQRPQSLIISPGQNAQVGWAYRGDDVLPIPRPTVGPLSATPGSIPNNSGVNDPWAGVTFGGTGSIDIASSYRSFTACTLQSLRVDILINGSVALTGSWSSSANEGRVDGTISVNNGDVLTAYFHHDGGSCAIYLDGTGGLDGEAYNLFTVTGTLTPP